MLSAYSRYYYPMFENLSLDEDSDNMNNKGLIETEINMIKKKENLQKLKHCSICQNKIKIGVVVNVLPVCNHNFHRDCLKKWVKDKITCPNCRSNI